MDETDDCEVSRYLASYIKQHENMILKYSQKEDCDFINEDELYKVIKKFYAEMI